MTDKKLEWSPNQTPLGEIMDHDQVMNHTLIDDDEELDRLRMQTPDRDMVPDEIMYVTSEDDKRSVRKLKRKRSLSDEGMDIESQAEELNPVRRVQPIHPYQVLNFEWPSPATTEVIMYPEDETVSADAEKKPESTPWDLWMRRRSPSPTLAARAFSPTLTERIPSIQTLTDPGETMAAIKEWGVFKIRDFAFGARDPRHQGATPPLFHVEEPESDAYRVNDERCPEELKEEKRQRKEAKRDAQLEEERILEAEVRRVAAVEAARAQARAAQEERRSTPATPQSNRTPIDPPMPPRKKARKMSSVFFGWINPLLCCMCPQLS
ncbi:hypothetical protein B0H16DRAFT_1735257 [Mycena metata]|uniref:Uncharacterized protein n=1 Tax=Mycena metata TaxID=1033252 RepID=A0AAD7MQ67_9AGAR|nr:hypothetical protein B0H16DRAFT_1735257 [Mycena metata]